MGWECCGSCKYIKSCMDGDDEFDFYLVCDEYEEDDVNCIVN